MGRPRLTMTEEQENMFIEAITMFPSVNFAAQYVGVSEPWLRNALKRDDAQAFRARFEKAVADKTLEMIVKASEGEKGAEMWLTRFSKWKREFGHVDKLADNAATASMTEGLNNLADMFRSNIDENKRVYQRGRDVEGGVPTSQDEGDTPVRQDGG